MNVPYRCIYLLNSFSSLANYWYFLYQFTSVSFPLSHHLSILIQTAYQPRLPVVEGVLQSGHSRSLRCKSTLLVSSCCLWILKHEQFRGPSLFDTLRSHPSLRLALELLLFRLPKLSGIQNNMRRNESLFIVKEGKRCTLLYIYFPLYKIYKSQVSC